MYRFWSKVDVGEKSECWKWKGSRWKSGYGRFTIKQKAISAHRFIYEKLNGKILGNLVAMHTCDNPSCCNPNHIISGTRKDNAIDMMTKGRQNFQKRPWTRPSKEQRSKIMKQKAKRGTKHYKTSIYKNGVPVDKVREMIKNGISQYEIANQLGLSQSVVSGINTGIHWSVR